MFKVVKNNIQTLHAHGDVNYLFVEKWSISLENAIEECDAIVITTKDVSWFNDIVLQLRTHRSVSVFLKPLFYKYNITSDYVIHTDGLFEEGLNNPLVKSINDKSQNITQLSLQGDLNICNRLTQFLFTRDAKLNPVKNRYSKIGYIYPFISLYFINKDYEIEKQLQNLIKADILSVELKDKVQLCNDCHDSYLIYKETCPKCNSIDLTSHDIIHHFTCAHVAPQEQFMNADNDQLQCPKCDKHLRHIGIDYDKPSSVYNCNTCSHDFQVPEVIAECHSCNSSNTLETLIEVPIYDYELTMKGSLTAEGKYEIKTEEDKQEPAVFDQLVEQEMQRSFQCARSSYIIKTTLSGELLNIIDSNFINSFWNDIEALGKQYVGSSLYCLRVDQTMQLLLVDKENNEAKATYDKLIYNMELLLSDNLKTHINIEHKLIDIKQI